MSRATGFYREAWLFVARNGWSTQRDIVDNLPSGVEADDPSAMLWSMANRNGMLKVRGEDRQREYAVTQECCAPKGLKVGEILSATGADGSRIAALQQSDAFLAFLRGALLSNAPQLSTESGRRQLFDECVRIRALISAVAPHQPERFDWTYEGMEPSCSGAYVQAFDFGTEQDVAGGGDA